MQQDTQRLYELCSVITKECDDWLESIGYYEKPASLKFHGTENGDLFRHSLTVAMQLQFFTQRLGLVWLREESPFIVGLLHDVCKCDDYIRDGDTWIYNRKKHSGHGEKSISMLVGHIDLTDEEICCIGYHMGAFVDKELWGYYTKAVNRYPNVLYTHTADMVASQILSI